MQPTPAPTSRGRLITRLLLGFVGVLISAIGVLHAVVNARMGARAIARAEVRQALGDAFMANAVVSGAILTLLGILLLVCAYDLRGASRTAWSVGFLIGLFLIACGVAGYAWRPVAAVLVFSLAGALVTVPLLLWRRALDAS